MIKLSLTGTVNRVTIEQSFYWITGVFKSMSRHSRATVTNILLYGVFSALVTLLSSMSSLGLIAYLFFFPVIGSIIINLHSAREKSGLEPGFYYGFRAPHFKRLLLSNFYLALVCFVVILLFVVCCSYSGMFSEENKEMFQKLQQYIISHNGRIDPSDLKNISASLGIDLNLLLRLFSQIVIASMVLLIVFTLVMLYFMLVPFFIVLTFEDVKSLRINMYFLSFRAFVKIANFIPYLLYGIVVGFGSFFYLLLTAGFIGALHLPVPLTIVLSSLLNAPLSVFFIYSFYFMFIDLFCDRACKEASPAEQNGIRTMKI